MSLIANFTMEKCKMDKCGTVSHFLIKKKGGEEGMLIGPLNSLPTDTGISVIQSFR